MVSRGFTLLELMLVLLLLGIAYGLTGPVLSEKPSSLELRTATGQLAAGLRRARDIAITRQQDSVLTLDLKRHHFTVTGDSKIYPLSNALELAMFTASSEVLKSGEGQIRFFPDGSSTGGRITVALNRTSRGVDVDWLTGRSKVIELP